MVRMREKYTTEVLPALAGELGRTNPMALPRLAKICINMGVGKALQEAKLLDYAVEDLTAITGQQAVPTRAKRAVSNFKVRQGWKIGCRVTLRGARMYEFMDRLVNAAMPRIRDFQGVKTRSFDGAGNYTMGLEEQTVFPEIEPDRAEFSQGMDITFVIKNSRSADESRRFLQLMGMPFQR